MMETPARPQKINEGELVDIDDEAYEAWVARGCPTEPPLPLGVESDD